jgi:hypothetical protein
VKAAQAELEKAFAGTETEKALRLSLESKLSAMKKMQEGDLEMTLALEEKDRSGADPWETLTSHYVEWEKISPSPFPFLPSCHCFSLDCNDLLECSQYSKIDNWGSEWGWQKRNGLVVGERWSVIVL